MNAIVIYDSVGGNTTKVAETIHDSLMAKLIPAHLIKVTNTRRVNLFDYDLIFIGSPVIDWLPTQNIIRFVKKNMKDFSQRGLIRPSAPILPGKFGISFGTYAGPHIGKKEATPMTMWLNSFIEHLGYIGLDQWLVVGKHNHKPEINKNGRLGNIEDRPNESDLLAVQNKVKGVVDSLSAWNPGIDQEDSNSGHLSLLT